LINLADVVWVTEGPAASLELQRESTGLARRRGLVAQSMWSTAETTWTLFDLGDWDGVLQAAEEVLAWDKDKGVVSRIVEPMKAYVLALRGERAGAERVMGNLDSFRTIGDPQVLVPALTVTAMLAMEEGNRDAAAESIRERLDVMSKREGSFAIFHTEAARVIAATGQLELLEELRSQDDLRLLRTELSMTTSGAIAAEAAGRSKEALEAYTDVARGWAAYGHSFETAQAELGAGRCLLELGRPGEASSRLQEARATLSGLGAMRALAETDRLLARATAKSS
jgi:tetratricopeptide (TPR) repeat protein